MFSGIIETTGIIKKINKSGSGLNFEVITNKKNYLKNLPVGASISVNGACM
ncbi:MAG TPA: riboflavin synthase, partial [Bacteroidetes bacterium]|nr:riboflavin synthase [Bacteroidota bacterium]